MNAEFARPLCIASTHPSLAGHFPGQPLVPGVVLLEQVALALRAWRAQRLVRVVEAKFVAPLLPGESATLCLTSVATGGSAARFEIHRDGTLLARGLVEGVS